MRKKSDIKIKHYEDSLMKIKSIEISWNYFWCYCFTLWSLAHPTLPWAPFSSLRWELNICKCLKEIEIKRHRVWIAHYGHHKKSEQNSGIHSPILEQVQKYHDIQKILFYTYVRSILGYCTPVWSPHSNNHIVAI